MALVQSCCASRCAAGTAVVLPVSAWAWKKWCKPVGAAQWKSASRNLVCSFVLWRAKDFLWKVGGW